MVDLTDADICNVIRAERKSATDAERERCAKIAEDVYRFSSGLTVERNVATKILPWVAKAIREEPK
jgi:hypothetical protein